MKKTFLRTKFTALGLMIVLCSSAMTIPAFAGDATDVNSPDIETTDTNLGVEARSTRDIPFFFNLNAWDTGVTSGIPKDDYSSTYVFAKSLDNPCQLFVDGWRQGSTWINYTVNGRAYLNYTGEFAIKQNVKESGCDTARLGAYRSGYKTNVEGVWSADSWGSYPVINA